MAVDLKSNSLVRRVSVVLETDALIKLEHQQTKDRLRKVMFDRVEGVFVWRQIPWVRTALVLLIVGGLGLLLMLADEVVATVIGVMFLLMAILGTVRYLYCKKTTIRIVRAGKNEDIVGVFGPAKVKRFVGRLEGSIRARQAGAGGGESQAAAG